MLLLLIEFKSEFSGPKDSKCNNKTGINNLAECLNTYLELFSNSIKYLLLLFSPIYFI